MESAPPVKAEGKYSLVQLNWFSDVTDACNSGASSDHREPISLHQAVHAVKRRLFPQQTASWKTNLQAGEDWFLLEKVCYGNERVLIVLICCSWHPYVFCLVFRFGCSGGIVLSFLISCESCRAGTPKDDVLSILRIFLALLSYQPVSYFCGLGKNWKWSNSFVRKSQLTNGTWKKCSIVLRSVYN